MLIRQTGTYTKTTIEGTLEELKKYFLIIFDFTSESKLFIENAHSVEELVEELNIAKLNRSSYSFISKSMDFKFTIAKRPSKNNIIASDFIAENKAKEEAKQKAKEEEMKKAELLKRAESVFESNVVSAQVGTFTEFGSSKFFTPVHEIDKDLVLAEDLIAYCQANNFTVMVTTVEIQTELTEGSYNEWRDWEPGSVEVFQKIEKFYVDFE